MKVEFVRKIVNNLSSFKTNSTQIYLYIMKLKLFILIVDSHASIITPDLSRDLEKEKLIYSRDFYIASPEELDSFVSDKHLKDKESAINRDNILVFMSSVHGNMITPGIISHKIKKANPNAKIIFRSIFASKNPDPSVFDDSIMKDPDIILGIIKEFIAKTKVA